MDLFTNSSASSLGDRDTRGPADAFRRTQGILSKRAAAAAATPVAADESQPDVVSGPPNKALLDAILEQLDDDKAEDVVTVDMSGKSAMCDYLVIASGRSQRQVAAMAEHLRERMKPMLPVAPPIEGLPQGDWVLVDAGDVIAHIFRPEVRAFYRLERMWGLETPGAQTDAAGDAVEDDLDMEPRSAMDVEDE